MFLKENVKCFLSLSSTDQQEQKILFDWPMREQNEEESGIPSGDLWEE